MHAFFVWTSYQQLFSSYMYVEKAAKTMFVQRICTFNVDEIDTWERESEFERKLKKERERVGKGQRERIWKSGVCLCVCVCVCVCVCESVCILQDCSTNQ